MAYSVKVNENTAASVAFGMANPAWRLSLQTHKQLGDQLMFELSKDFRFDAAHTLTRFIDAESSRRIHGHSYRAQVIVRGTPDPATGMIVDLGVLEAAMGAARDGLDHRFLDEVPDLGPPTMENLAVWVWRTLEPQCKGLSRVVIYRDASGESCAYLGGAA